MGIIDIFVGVIVLYGLNLNIVSAVAFAVRIYGFVALMALFSDRFRVEQVEEVPTFAQLWWWLDRRRQYFLDQYESDENCPTDAIVKTQTILKHRYATDSTAEVMQELHLCLLEILF